MSNSCGGCQYCEFPYKATLPIRIDDNYPEKVFESKEDIWEVIDLLLKETKTLNKQKGSEFDPIANVISQIPFFGCYNHIREPKHLKLINKYIYCTETGTPAHTGGYGDQPATWVEYFFIIKNALAKKEKQLHDKMNRKAKTNG